MEFYVDKLDEILQAMKQQREFLQKEYDSCPDGRLNMTKQGGRYRYFHARNVNGRTVYKGITGDRDVQMRLARKEFLEQTLEGIDRDIGLVGSVVRKFTVFDPARVIGEMKRAYRSLPEKYFFYRGAEAVDSDRVGGIPESASPPAALQISRKTGSGSGTGNGVDPGAGNDHAQICEASFRRHLADSDTIANGHTAAEADRRDTDGVAAGGGGTMIPNNTESSRKSRANRKSLGRIAAFAETSTPSAPVMTAKKGSGTLSAENTEGSGTFADRRGRSDASRQVSGGTTKLTRTDSGVYVVRSPITTAPPHEPLAVQGVSPGADSLLMPSDAYAKSRLRAHKEWSEAPYRQNDKHPECKDKITSRGLHMRSKSEVMIAELLYQYGIPFRYEEPLYIDGVMLAPDFTFRGADLLKFYWEYCGMMDDPKYVDHHIWKKNLYERHGIVPWKNIYFTYESGGNIDLKAIRHFIEDNILPRM